MTLLDSNKNPGITHSAYMLLISDAVTSCPASAVIGLTRLLLFRARLLSAANNIVHDCDETFNYWEPLHYITYGYGLQTWEYR